MSDIKSINDLFGLNFVIPSYQRGYRWDKTQVRDLLEDIWNFCEKEDDKKDSFYCLQPIIVKKYEQDEKKYKLVDGQQRLTTIYMILSHFKLYMDDSRYESFEIEYETRKDSKDFLKNIQEKYKTNEKESNIDFYYMSKAYEYIEKWFSENNNRRQEFFRILTSQNNIAKNVRIIWHEIEDNEDEREVFSRINSGKIPLTNAELIKALFLNSNNFKKEEVDLRQIEISKEWDEMEYALQNNEFWRFLTSDEDYPARIELLFKTYYKIKKDEKYEDSYVIYRFFADKLKGDNKLKVLDEIWLEVKKIFLTFKYWYENHKLYHLIGYLNVLENKESEKSLVSLYKESSKKSKEDFVLFIEEQISKRVNVKNISEIKEMSYEDNKNEIKKILLLFNIATYLESDIRFSFDKFISEKWSLEHINPQSRFTIKSKDEKKQWMKEIIDILKLLQDDNSNEQTTSLLKKLIDNINENIDDKKFADITNDVFEYFSPEDKHSIANLTLLSLDTNSKLSNHIFAIKRNKLKEDEKNGKFIPLCTKNVFMKYYSEKFDDIKNIYFWTSSDQDSYLKAIEEKINVFIKNGE
ncbi:DUF262 domain-containing protein [Campylobacter lari]|uniref:DUF262 domain-containing protein n=1 Tax=unclassified Campylobacter TaxID=2593542 RepID=UPI0021E6901B|nr:MULTISPECIES: DUF262 domain-containing protein [unclassified Campylobacter]MCR8698520.1 DUF262 domain-containing protein [Campylobacter sp. LMG 7929]MCV3386374.1 DUF262 domain-containing protein [Campylobacter lari]MCV3349729.1 DUF262 domain-containing protein [Campylobacter sp. RKI_CA19_01127]MCV3355317.1 DUF262 domain-containing protein [Campylobacter sp. RKI_CA19_01128]MCV3403890.1 DUF262 domain-containing protein [Campylobacter sp. IFREMER_LSEM_CL2090]